MIQSDKKVMVFGVFDGLHGGHRAFLKQAGTLGELVVVVAQDATVETMKQKRPRISLGHRIAAIKDAGLADVLVAGDLVQYSWGAVRRYEPDVIALGYDQKGLKDALKIFQEETQVPFDIVVMDPHDPEKLHSSILHADVAPADTFDVFKKKRIAEKKKRFDKGEYLADFVYGANDGIITTFAVVAGAAGAALPAGVIVILGVANLIADGFSMGASSILSMLS